MSQDEFTKLFKYIESFRQEVNARLDKTQDSIDRLTNILKLPTRKIQQTEILC